MIYDFFISKKKSRAGSFLVRRTLKKILFLISPYLGKGRKVLEIGPGTGEFLKAASETGSSLWAIEANKKLAVLCKKICPAAVVLHAAAPPVRMKKNSFDLVYASGVIEHLAGHGELLELFAGSFNVLKKDGALVLVFPDCLSWKKTFYDIDYSHGYFTTLNRIWYLLADTGFTVVKSVHFSGPFTGPARILLLPLLKLVTFLFSFLYALSGREIFLKGKIAFLTNILVIAKKDRKQER